MADRPCPTCNGSKTVTEKVNGRWQQVKCWFCGGTGIDPR